MPTMLMDPPEASSMPPVPGRRVARAYLGSVLRAVVDTRRCTLPRQGDTSIIGELLASDVAVFQP